MTDIGFNKFHPITFTKSAILEIETTIANKGIPLEYGLRVGIKGGGCSGVSYMLGFDKLKDNDEVFELGAIKVLIEKKHVMFLAGIEIDFEDGANARGFVFNQQGASASNEIL